MRAGDADGACAFRKPPQHVHACAHSFIFAQGALNFRMAASDGGTDPEPDRQRVKLPEWLVVVGVCTHMGCVPNRESSGWMCHCHGSRYDDSGRVLRGPAPKNLEVPPYRFIAADKIIIGVA